jgi:hypothetical protein
MSLKKGEDKQFDEDVLRHYGVNPDYVHELYFLPVKLKSCNRLRRRCFGSITNPIVVDNG